MSKHFIAPKATGFFSDLICDYLKESPSVSSLFHRSPNLKGLIAQSGEKKEQFPLKHRQVLKSALTAQYAHTDISKATEQNISALADSNTFTVTTGHQLNLFTGPLYFLYKIISTLNLTKELKAAHPENNYVPVYWMATEDHDFEEINFFNFKGKKFQWQGPEGAPEQGGAVGELPTDGLDKLLDLFKKELDSGKHAAQLAALFENAYLKHGDLTAATRYLANELFKEDGLVIIDAADKSLKELFIPYMKRELLEQTTYREVGKTVSEINSLGKGYAVQVNPREINLFYLEKGLRERVVMVDNEYVVNETPIKWTRNELMELLEKEPQRFSPNVLLRPLYQEVILPNICYIGGGGELAYWLQLKGMFAAMEVPFPVLLLRNSALVIEEKQSAKLARLNITYEQLFLDEHAFINRKVREISNVDIDLTPQRAHLVKQFQDLYELAAQTDKSFLGAVKAQEVKQLKGLNHLEKRLLKAQKRKLKDQVSRMTAIRNELFPNGNLQERTANFSNLYEVYGHSFIEILKNSLDPLHRDFVILILDQKD